MSGKLYGLGVGPGDPELMTLKAHRILGSVSVIAYPAPDNGDSFARSIVSGWLREDQKEIPIVIPMRTERFPARQVYDEAAREIGKHLETGLDVAVLCEGDPFFYGSFMYLFERFAHACDVEIVPGVSSLTACAAALQRPLAARNDTLTVIPAPLEDARISELLEASDAAAIIKVGRHLGRVRALIDRLGLGSCSGYLERAGLPEQRMMMLDELDQATAPYFSMILIYKGTEGWIGNLDVPRLDEARP